MRIKASILSVFACLATLSSAHAQAEKPIHHTKSDILVRFEVERDAYAEMGLVRSVDEETGEKTLVFTGELVSSEGVVLIESFTVVENMQRLVDIADAYIVTRTPEEAIAWASGAPGNFEFLTLDGNKIPATVIAGSADDQMEVRVDIFRGTRALQHEFSQAGGEGSVAVAIALMFRDLHTSASNGDARGDQGECEIDFDDCEKSAKCTCGAGRNCCAVNATQAYCYVASLTFSSSTCTCSFTCHPRPEL